MTTSRRQFLALTGGLTLAAAGGGASLLFGWGRPSQTGALLSSQVPLPKPFSVPLPIPGAAEEKSPGAYLLRLQEADAEILPGRSTRVWGYDGTFPGPTISAGRDEPIEVTVRNQLQIPSATHLHGGHTSHEHDGYPTDPILPRGGHWEHRMLGDTTTGERTYRYELQQRAATLWYHDHSMDFTGPNVYHGLAGFFLVRDDEERALPLPEGNRDIPLMVCDRAFDGDGQFRYPALSPTQDEPGVEDRYMGGVLGDVVLVNGAPWPELEVSAARYRFRILNASNARRYQFELDPPPPEGSAFTQIGTDGGLLEEPFGREEVTLASAERADVLIDFSAYDVGTIVTMRNGFGSGGTADVMRFRVVRKETDYSEVPETLSEFETLDEGAAVVTRDFRFELGRPGSDATSAHDGPGMQWLINGRVFDPAYDEATPRAGDVEIWRFLTDVHHPVHVHLEHFQVLSRNQRSPGDNDRGWKDTIDLIPGESAEVILRFTDYPGRYVMHCHNLEHEDMAMMANFRVV